jgi:hypothetical protein
MNKYEKLEKIAQEGYELEFGTVLDHAINNYKQIFGVAGVSMLILMMVLFGALFGVIGVVFGFSAFSSTMTDFNPAMLSGTLIVIYFIAMVLFSGIMANINAGFYKMCFLADSNQRFSIGTMFDYFKTSHFKEIFISGVLIASLTTTVTLLFEYLDLKYVGALITYIISYLTFLTIALIIFSDLKATEAISMSIKLSLKKPLLLIGLLLLAIILAMLGIIALCIGIFFTLPFIYSMVYCIYAAIAPFEEVNVLDEIGANESE